MTDTISAEHRSWNMSQIRGKDTTPELAVRSLLHRLGYRFRVHRRDLPGTPDIVLPKYKAAVLVHGCYWHRHAGCQYAYTPKTRREFWLEKFRENVERDHKARTELTRLGWRTLVVWECQITDTDSLASVLVAFLESQQRSGQLVAEEP